MVFGRKKRAGMVYLGESTRKNSSKKIYTGITRRPVKTRWGEHISTSKSENSKTWVGKGTSFKPITFRIIFHIFNTISECVFFHFIS